MPSHLSWTTLRLSRFHLRVWMIRRTPLSKLLVIEVESCTQRGKRKFWTRSNIPTCRANYKSVEAYLSDSHLDSRRNDDLGGVGQEREQWRTKSELEIAYCYSTAGLALSLQWTSNWRLSSLFNDYKIKFSLKNTVQQLLIIADGLDYNSTHYIEEQNHIWTLTWYFTSD